MLCNRYVCTCLLKDILVFCSFQDKFEGLTGHIAFNDDGKRYNYTILLTEVSVVKNRMNEVCTYLYKRKENYEKNRMKYAGSIES